MTDTKYNGWTNYATWRVNLELFDDYQLDYFDDDTDPYDLGQEFKQLAEEIISENASGLALDYALAFMDDVNWYEIGERILSEAQEARKLEGAEA